MKSPMRLHLVLAAIALLLACGLAAVNLWRYATFRTAGPIDLAYFNQQLFNAWNGMEPLTVQAIFSRQREGPEPWRTGRLRPVTVVAALLYPIWERPEWLLILQSLALAAGLWGAYRATRCHLDEPWFAVGVALLYACSPLLWLMGTNDFRYIYLGIPLLPFAYEAVARRRAGGAFLWIAAILMCRVQLWPAAATLALGLLLQPYRFRKNFQWASAIAAGCIFWWMLSFVYVGALFGPATAWINIESVFEPNRHFGQNPGQEWYALIEESQRMLWMLGPFILLGWAAPEFLIPGLVLCYPPLKMGLFTFHPAQQFVRFHSPAAAVLILAVCVSMTRIGRWMPGRQWRVGLLLAGLATMLAGQFYTLRLVLTLPSRVAEADVAWLREAIDRIPPAEGVFASRPVLPNLSSRTVLYDYNQLPLDMSLDDAINRCQWGVVDRRQEPLIAYLQQTGWNIVEQGESIVLLNRPCER